MGGSLVLGLDWLSNPQVSRAFGSLHKTARPYLCCCHSWGGGGGTPEEVQGRGRAGQVGGSEVISYMSRCEQMECLAVFRSQAASTSLAHRVTQHLPSPNPIWSSPLPSSLPLWPPLPNSLSLSLSLMLRSVTWWGDGFSAISLLTGWNLLLWLPTSPLRISKTGFGRGLPCGSRGWKLPHSNLGTFPRHQAGFPELATHPLRSHAQTAGCPSLLPVRLKLAAGLCTKGKEPGGEPDNALNIYLPFQIFSGSFGA